MNKEEIITRLERLLRRSKRLHQQSLDLDYQFGQIFHSGRCRAYEEAIELCKRLTHEDQEG